MLPPYEQLGMFYLGRRFNASSGKRLPDPFLYESRDLVTHAVGIGMTGSGKTGLGISVIEEAAIDGIPVLAIDPKGDLSNLLLTFPSLTGADFAPWVDPAAASSFAKAPRDTQAQGDLDRYAEHEANRWKNGLAEWG